MMMFYKKVTSLTKATGIIVDIVGRVEQDSDVAGPFYSNASTPSGEVRCPLPSFNPDDPGTLKLYNWSVSVSNDNATWSDSVQVLVYDPLYVTCVVDGNGTYQCRCLPSENQVKLSSSQSISRSATQSACIKILWRVVQC